MFLDSAIRTEDQIRKKRTQVNLNHNFYRQHPKDGERYCFQFVRSHLNRGGGTPILPTGGEGINPSQVTAIIFCDKRALIVTQYPCQNGDPHVHHGFDIVQIGTFRSILVLRMTPQLSHVAPSLSLTDVTVSITSGWATVYGFSNSFSNRHKTRHGS